MLHVLVCVSVHPRRKTKALKKLDLSNSSNMFLKRTFHLLTEIFTSIDPLYRGEQESLKKNSKALTPTIESDWKDINLKSTLTIVTSIF